MLNQVEGSLRSKTEGESRAKRMGWKPARPARLQFEFVQMAEQTTGEERAKSEVSKSEEAATERQKFKGNRFLQAIMKCATVWYVTVISVLNACVLPSCD